MKRAALIALALLVPSSSYAWDVVSMNWAIEQTNFLVGGNCSGTLISVPERLVLTNFHCIEDKISIIQREVVSADGVVKTVKARRLADIRLEQHVYSGYERVSTTAYIGEIVADSKKQDLAVLRLKGTIPHTYASPLLPDGASITRGERVYAVGNPALQESTVVEGIVSNVNRTFEFSWTGGEKLAMIQFSGGIYGGNSGGALYNASGQLIGVPAAGLTGVTFVGLAVPVSVVREMLHENCVTLTGTPDSSCPKRKAILEDKD